MKKLMILVSAIMMAATANGKRVETSSFNEVRVNVPARVRILVGSDYSINVTASDSIVADAVKMEVRDGVLCINTRDIEALGDDAANLHITIVAPVEPQLTVGRGMKATTVRRASADNTLLANND